MSLLATTNGVIALPVFDQETRGQPRAGLPVTETLLSTLGDNPLRTPSSLADWHISYANLRKEQRNTPLRVDGPPRFPERSDFPPRFSVHILDSFVDVNIKHCVLILHDPGDNEPALRTLALRLQERHKQCAFILLRDDRGLRRKDIEHDRSNLEEADFVEVTRLSRILLVNVVKDCLVAKCRFNPREILLIGNCHGGTTVLAAAASWNEIELGGSVSIGGRMPVLPESYENGKAKTPALVIGGEAFNMSLITLQQIQRTFHQVHVDRWPAPSDEMTKAENMSPLFEFLAHRLGRAEWMKQAVISFGEGYSSYSGLPAHALLDGGGMRGYGSLLILKELMNKIGDEEKRIDPSVKSSFHPHEYKPSAYQPTKQSSGKWHQRVLVLSVL